MRKAIFTILAFLTLTLGLAQSVPELRAIADDHYEKEQFRRAIQYYEKVVGLDKKDVDSRFKLAIALFKIFDFERAKEELIKVAEVNDPSKKATALLYLGNILKLNENYKEADSVYTYILKNIETEDFLLAQARKERDGSQLAIAQSKKERGFSIREMGELNSDYHDFGAAVNRKLGTLAYVTARNVGSKQYQGGTFAGLLPDLVHVEPRNNGRWRTITGRDNFKSLNSEWAEGSGSFTKDGMLFYFTSCKNQDGSQCQIMYSKYEDEKWSEPTALNNYINLPGFENKHPFISNTGDTLFFVSNRDGGFGGNDIWMSLRGIDEQSWTPAINLGEVINTRFDEITPYYSSVYNALVFASNGHVGYGGFDLFIAKGESFFEPDIYNAGPPFNSQLDDTYFYIYDSIGYISSNRKDRVNLNLYEFDVNDERLYLSLLVSGESLIDSRVVSKYKQIRSIDLVTFRIEDYQGFELFEPVKRQKPKPDILRDNPFDDKENMIADNQDDPTYYPEVQPEIIRNQNPEKSFQTSRQLVRPGPGGNEYEKVYFGFDQSTLNKDGKIALIKLADQLKALNGAYESVEIRVYADPTGSYDYNMRLSAQRGQQVQAYLVSLGVPKVRLSVLPEGEENLISKGNQWYDYFFNRRAEIVVHGDRPINLQKAYKVVMRTEMKVIDCASSLGVGEEELRRWNNLTAEKLSKGDILRIERQLAVAPDINYFLDEKDIQHNFFQYEVKEGDSLESVARKFNNPEELVRELNKLTSPPAPGDILFLYSSL
mgnify:CR=1 FL=1